jgi:diguanylate cyclase (GGDEF)-like protein
MKRRVDLKKSLYDKVNSIGYFGILIAFPLLILIIGMNFWLSNKSEEAEEWITHTHLVQSSLSQVLSALQDAETGQRGYLLTEDAKYLEPYVDAVARLDGVLTTLQTLTSENPNQQNKLNRVKPLIDKKLEELKETIVLMKTQGLESALTIVVSDKGKQFMDQIRSIINEMENEESALLIDRQQTLYKNKIFVLYIQIIGFILLILISILIFLKFRKLLYMQVQAEEELRYISNHDSLTGLATRQLGVEFLFFALAEARRNKNKVAVLFIDLDGFKTVNDTLGHYAGDCLLQGVAERLLHSVREIDTTVRMGGDEFMVVLAGINCREDVAQIAQKQIDALTKPFSLGGKDAYISASIGIALYPDDEQEPEALIKRADGAMYQVKGNGKNHFIFAADK